MTLLEHKECVYDNPKTFRREWWINGEMVAFISIEILHSPNNVWIHSPLERIHNLGKWKIGNVWGDMDALNKDKEIK
jgi:hypothetical protein